MFNDYLFDELINIPKYILNEVYKPKLNIEWHYPDDIKKVDIIEVGRIIKVTFFDGKFEIMTVQGDDIFDSVGALYIAYAKRLYKKNFTFNYVERMSKEELPCNKYYIKKVKAGMKLYEAAEKEIEEKNENKATKERRKQKKIRYKQRKAERKNVNSSENLENNNIYEKANEILKDKALFDALTELLKNKE